MEQSNITFPSDSNLRFVGKAPSKSRAAAELFKWKNYSPHLGAATSDFVLSADKLRPKNATLKKSHAEEVYDDGSDDKDKGHVHKKQGTFTGVYIPGKF